MSRIDELIEQICPEGVVLKEIGKIANILNGFSFKSGEYVESGIRVIRISDVQKGKMSDKEMKFYPTKMKDEIKNYLLNENDLVMSLTGNVGRVAMLSKHHLPAGLNQRVACIRTKSDEILIRFLFHFFDQKIFEIEAMTNATGGGQKNMSTTWLAKYKIPIPPLPIQQEIVSILDKFTMLEAELEAELEARRKQYEYYRNELLKFEGKAVEWKTLGEVGEFIRGSGMQKSDFTDSGVGCIHYGQIYTYFGFSADKTKTFVSPELAKKLRKAKKGDIVMATTSENIEDVCKTVVWLGEDEIAISGETYIFKHNQNAKFIAYYLKTPPFHAFKNQSITGTKVIRVHGEKLKKFSIPIPPMKEQERIVGILDKFEALVNDISIGLPAEIEARRKQYEYYRGKLLNFKIKNNG